MTGPAGCREWPTSGRGRPTRDRCRPPPTPPRPDAQAGAAIRRGMNPTATAISTVKTAPTRNTWCAATLIAAAVGLPLPREARVRDGAEQRDPDGAAHRAGEHVGAGDDPAVGPVDAGLRGDQRRARHQPHAEPDDEAVQPHLPDGRRRPEGGRRAPLRSPPAPSRSGRCRGSRSAGRADPLRLAASGQPRVSVASAKPGGQRAGAQRGLHVRRHVRGQTPAPPRRPGRWSRWWPRAAAGATPTAAGSARPRVRSTSTKPTSSSGPRISATRLGAEFQAQAWPPSQQPEDQQRAPDGQQQRAA